MDFTTKLQQYARLAIRAGLDVQKGQGVVIEAALEAAPFVRAAAKEAWEAGARDVTVLWTDEELTRLRYQSAEPSLFDTVADWKVALYNGLAARGDAFLSVRSGDPAALAGVDPARVAAAGKATHTACEPFYNGMHENKVPWCIVGAASPRWAKAVFPDLPEQEAMDRLWDAIFQTVRADTPDPIAAWEQHRRSFEKRTAWLNAQKFTQLHYHNNIGTDITIGLPDGVQWGGGGGMLTDGRWWFPNMPTEEIFTAPHREKVNGTVHSAMPLNHQGSLIDDFSLTFKDGVVTDFAAAKGYDALKAILETDEGARHLGEVALVPVESPISRLGILFYNTLYDENASCHFAVGNAAVAELPEGITREQMTAWGLNESATHVDFMLGTPDLSITGTRPDGAEVPVFVNGNWAPGTELEE